MGMHNIIGMYVTISMNHKFGRYLTIDVNFTSCIYHPIGMMLIVTYYTYEISGAGYNLYQFIDCKQVNKHCRYISCVIANIVYVIMI